MAKRFSLGPLLAYRTLAYDLARVQLAEAQRLVNAQREVIARLHAFDHELIAGQAEALALVPVDVLSLRGVMRQRDAVQHSLVAAEGRLEELVAQAEAKRALAVKAQQEKKVMERLRERYRLRQMLEANRLEGVANDELATMQAARVRRAG